MRLLRLSRASLLASVALTPLPLFAAHAVERNLFTWTGNVDREVVIEIRGNDVFTRASGLDASYAPRLDVNQGLPRTPGLVRVHVNDGRGEVEVLENPSPRNNYTAKLRVRDPRSGADRYRLVVTFEADNPGGYGGNGPRDGGNGDWDRNNGNNGRGSDRMDRNDDYGRGRGNNGRNNDNRNNDGRNNDNRDYDRNRRDAGALRWSGVVDDVAEIRIQGGHVDMISTRGQPLRSVRYDVVGATMPRRDTRLEMVRESGRSKVRIVQQPSMWNGYTAIIRIDDSRPGASIYDFAVRW